MQKTVRSAHRQPSAHTAPSSVDTYPAMARCQPLALRQPRSRSAARIARSAASGTATSVGVSYSYKFLIYCCTILSAIHKLYRHCVPLLHQQSVEGMVCPCARAQVRPTGRPRWLFHEPDSRPSSAALSGSRQSHGRRVRAHLDECSLIAAWAREDAAAGGAAVACVSAEPACGSGD